MDTVDQHFEFHRLARSAPRHRWWKPLLTALLGVVFYVAFTIVVMVPALVLAALSSTGPEPYLDAFTVLDLSNPLVFAIAMVSLILMIPALALATLITGPRPIGLLSSVAGRIRWRWLLVCSVAALAVFGVSIGLPLPPDLLSPPARPPPPVQQDTSTLILLLALSLLVVPFQAAAEEYVFRGYLMQAIGSWLRHPAFAILLPVPLFALGQGSEPLGQADVAVFAIFAGWITWRTGGLEAAIAVHAVNNVTIFVLGAVGLVDVNATGSSVGGLVVSVLTMMVTAVILVRLADRRGIRRTRVVTPQPGEPYWLPPGSALPRLDGQYAYPPQPQYFQQSPPSLSAPSRPNPWVEGPHQIPPQQQVPQLRLPPPADTPRPDDAPAGPRPSGTTPASDPPVPPPRPPPELPGSGVVPRARARAGRPHRRGPRALPRRVPPRAGPARPATAARPSGPAFPPGTAFPPESRTPRGPASRGRAPPPTGVGGMTTTAGTTDRGGADDAP
ncbi:CPBP family intramembrane glutamic endopeptidase [Arthrobacter sp. RIT-PI-e]|uniref:CPBP family intramembrane glutamic endopeptidase n=1 Tax=Arthrobacter sp. RIT-PI-e TaxID=1681197 RepID=UPI000675D07B|nr:CPBP family intramembrane glutamic endopeptidase [Arthrobacter sp. RIT-PI-e]